MCASRNAVTQSKSVFALSSIPIPASNDNWLTLTDLLCPFGISVVITRQEEYGPAESKSGSRKAARIIDKFRRGEFLANDERRSDNQRGHHRIHLRIRVAMDLDPPQLRKRAPVCQLRLEPPRVGNYNWRIGMRQ